MAISDPVDTCMVCHEGLNARPLAFPQISSFASYLDIQEGGFDAEGRLVLTNSETGTTLDIFGMTLYERLSLFDLNEDSFEIEQEMSSDGGETWDVLTKLHYARAED